MLIELLRGMQKTWAGGCSSIRLLIPRCLGLRAARGVRVGRGITWPLGNLRNIRLDENVSLGKGGWIYLPLHNRSARLHIGAGTAIGDNFVIAANESIEIGRDCLVSYRVSILDHVHVTGAGIAPVTSGVTEGRPVHVGDKSFIGCNAVILPGVTLGGNCVVGANSVVTKSFLAGSVVAGAPAKLLRTLSPEKP